MTIRRSTSADNADALRMRTLAFGGTSALDPTWSRANAWHGLIAELDGRPTGFLRVYDYRQYFGGRPVPMGGVASVAVDPYARGAGIASALLSEALRMMRDAGQPISALYATAPALYRGRGWEQVGVYESVNLGFGPLNALPTPSRRLPRRPAAEGDVAAVHERYQRLAADVDGLLDRGLPVHRPADVLDCSVVDLVDPDGPDGLRGYLTATRTLNTGLTVHDLVAGDADTALTLLRSLATWSGQLPGVSLRLVDPVVSQLLLGLPHELDVHVLPWMLRVVDLPAAVAARGWPAASALRPTAVDLDVVDEHAPWHAGRQRLVIDDGVRLEPGGSGAVRITARGLAAWYSGAADTAGLRRAGLLDGDLDRAAVLDVLTVRGGVPRLADAF